MSQSLNKQPALSRTCECRVINEDEKPFEFTAALHSYFEVLNIGTIIPHMSKVTRGAGDCMSDTSSRELQDAPRSL
jgi:D-hexose-6-phosphate mutarotase